MENQTIFNNLNSVNCNGHTEKKNGLTYLSWAWAWAEVKKRYPTANYTIYENQHGWNYFTDGKTCWVKTGVTIGGLEHIEYLPVMDYRNASIPLEKVTSFDVNKAIQRSLTKAAARHGLGLYIYAGEDLPEENIIVSAKGTASGREILEGKLPPKKATKPDCPEDIWWKLVKAEVQGKKTKEGLTPLQYLQQHYRIDELTLAKFTQDIQMSRDAQEANETKEG